MEPNITVRNNIVEITGTCNKVPFFFKSYGRTWIYGASRLADPKEVALGRYDEASDGGIYFKLGGSFGFMADVKSCIRQMRECNEKLCKLIDRNVTSLKSAKFSPWEMRWLTEQGTWRSVKGRIRAWRQPPKYLGG